MKLVTDIWVNVTQNDIKRGKRMNCFQCPVSRATRRALKRNKVDTDLVSSAPLYIMATEVSSFRSEFKARTPDIVVSFMAEFDNGEPVYPFSFKLTNESTI